MIYRLIVPVTLEDVREVRVLEWHHTQGDAVAEGSLLVELETHKALIEVRAAQAAVLRSIACGEGEWCPLGGEVALLSDAVDEPLGGEDSTLRVDFRIG